MKVALSLVGLGLMIIGVLSLGALGALFVVNAFVIVAQVCAAALMVWARLTFGLRSFHAAANPTEGGLVTSGPYAYIRHPIYTAICLFVLPAALASWSVLGVALGTLVFAGSLMRMLSEERLLIGMYPAYATYAAATKRMIPRLF